MLGCLGLAGWRLGNSQAASLALAVVLPVVAAVVWGRWVAPRTSHRLADPTRLALEAALFTLTLTAILLSAPTPAMTAFALAVVAAFLVSIPARKHEPTPKPTGRS